MNKDKIIEDLKEELELVRCDLHNAYSWINGLEQENTQLKQELNQKNKIIEKLSNELNDYIKEYEPEKWEDMCRNKEILEELEKGDSNE